MDEENKKENSKVTRFKKRSEVKSAAGKKKLYLKEGFSYLVMKKDVNGFNFNSDHLREYSLELKYTITLALNEKGSTILHHYFVDGSNLKEFFKIYTEGKIEGDIIEIDKFNPEILA